MQKETKKIRLKDLDWSDIATGLGRSLLMLLHGESRGRTMKYIARELMLRGELRMGKRDPELGLGLLHSVKSFNAEIVAERLLDHMSSAGILKRWQDKFGTKYLIVQEYREMLRQDALDKIIRETPFDSSFLWEEPGPPFC